MSHTQLRENHNKSVEEKKSDHKLLDSNQISESSIKQSPNTSP